MVDRGRQENRRFAKGEFGIDYPDEGIKGERQVVNVVGCEKLYVSVGEDAGHGTC